MFPKLRASNLSLAHWHCWRWPLLPRVTSEGLPRLSRAAAASLCVVTNVPTLDRITSPLPPAARTSLNWWPPAPVRSYIDATRLLRLHRQTKPVPHSRQPGRHRHSTAGLLCRPLTFASLLIRPIWLKQSALPNAHLCGSQVQKPKQIESQIYSLSQNR